MNIYIDEAGSFIPTSRTNYISCVAGLIVPSAKEKYLFDRFLQLRTSWGSPASEIKGSTLNERQVEHVLRLLAKHDVLVEISAIGSSDLEAQGVTELKGRQAEAITAHLTTEHHPDVVESLQTMKEQTHRTANQLYLQSFALTRLCDQLIRVGTGFWSQRAPIELGLFQWRIDAKDKTVTEAEELWHKLFKAYLESKSLSDPGAQRDDPSFDYRHFEKFMMYEDEGDEESRRHLKYLRKVKGVPDSATPLKAVDLRALFSDLQFTNSRESLGLQLADIVASAFHRGCKGTLQKDGWISLGPLFVNKREAVVDVIMISDDPPKLQKQMEENTHLLDLLVTLKDRARSMMVED